MVPLHCQARRSLWEIHLIRCDPAVQQHQPHQSLQHPSCRCLFSTPSADAQQLHVQSQDAQAVAQHLTLPSRQSSLVASHSRAQAEPRVWMQHAAEPHGHVSRPPTAASGIVCRPASQSLGPEAEHAYVPAKRCPPTELPGVRASGPASSRRSSRMGFSQFSWLTGC